MQNNLFIGAQGYKKWQCVKFVANSKAQNDGPRKEANNLQNSGECIVAIVEFQIEK